MTTYKEKEVTENVLPYEGYPHIQPYKVNSDENLVWYCHDSGEWGCWIQNRCKRPMKVPKSWEQATKYPSDPNHYSYGKKYASPIPLHPPEVNIKNFKPHMTWVVDEQGWGLFLYLVREHERNGRVKHHFREIIRIPPKL